MHHVFGQERRRVFLSETDPPGLNQRTRPRPWSSPRDKQVTSMTQRHANDDTATREENNSNLHAS